MELAHLERETAALLSSVRQTPSAGKEQGGKKRHKTKGKRERRKGGGGSRALDASFPSKIRGEGGGDGRSAAGAPSSDVLRLERKEGSPLKERERDRGAFASLIFSNTGSDADVVALDGWKEESKGRDDAGTLSRSTSRNARKKGGKRRHKRGRSGSHTPTRSKGSDTGRRTKAQENASKRSSSLPPLTKRGAEQQQYVLFASQDNGRRLI